MLKKLTLLIALLASVMIHSQEIEFGEVTKEELFEEQYIQDPEAHAAVLYYYRNTYFSSNQGGFQLVTEVQKRIKIYDEQGYDFATEEIDLFKTRGSTESVGKVKAYTYNLEGDKIEKTELKKDQVFKTEIRYNYNQVKFTMPNVKAGSVIEFEYKITSPFYFSIDEFEFQDEIPIKKIEAKLTFPKGFILKPNYKGYVSFYPKESQSYNARIEMTTLVNTFNLHNVPALKNEAYVDNINNYRAGVNYELVAIQLPTFNRTYAQTWSDVAKSIGNVDDYEVDLDRPGPFKKEIDALVGSETNEKDKLRKIFDYVREKITWNGFDGKYFYNGIKKALKEKEGNSADINLTLVSMLRYAGIQAHPVVISTKDNAIPFFPTLDRLNYVVAYAKIGQEEIFMDATDEFSDLNLLPIKDYNWQGMLINNEDRVWRKIMISQPKQAVGQHQLNAVLNDDGSIEGNYKCRLSNHHAKKLREALKDQDLEEYIVAKEEEYNNIEISDYEIKGNDTYLGNLNENFNYYHEDAVEVVGDQLILKPMLFLATEDNPLKLEERKFPIDFGYAFKDQYLINVTLPEGYQATEEMKPLVMKTPDGAAVYRFMPKISGNQLQLSVVFEVKRAMISATNYAPLKEFFNQMISKENQQLVLTKI